MKRLYHSSFTPWRLGGRIVLLLLLSGSLSAQPARYQLHGQIEGAYTFFAVDALRQVYAVGADAAILKFDAAGRTLFRYDNSTLGPPALLDVSNPFNLLLYYPDYQTIVLLDRTLNERSRLDLRQTKLQNATTVARSFDDNSWVYDDWAYRLVKLDARGKILLMTDDLRMLLGLSAAPAAILAEKDRVYLYFPDKGLAAFTNYGQFLRWIDLPSTQRWSWSGERLLLQVDDRWSVWHPSVEAPVSLPAAADWQQSGLILYRNNQFYDLTPGGIRIWREGPVVVGEE